MCAPAAPVPNPHSGNADGGGRSSALFEPFARRPDLPCTDWVCHPADPTDIYYCPAATASTSVAGNACFSSASACNNYFAANPALTQPTNSMTGTSTCTATSFPCSYSALNCSGAAPGMMFACGSVSSSRANNGVQCFSSAYTCGASSSNSCNNVVPPPPAYSTPTSYYASPPPPAGTVTPNPCVSNGPICQGAGSGNSFYCRSSAAGAGSSVSISGTVCYTSDAACVADLFNPCTGCTQAAGGSATGQCAGAQGGASWFCNAANAAGCSGYSQYNNSSVCCFSSSATCAASSICVGCQSSSSVCAQAGPGNTWWCNITAINAAGRSGPSSLLIAASALAAVVAAASWI